MRNGLKSVGKRVLAGQDREYAGHGAGRGRIDPADQGMRVRRAQRRAMGLARKIEIVAVAAAAGEEAQVLLAAYGVSNTCLHSRAAPSATILASLAFAAHPAAGPLSEKACRDTIGAVICVSL